MDFFISPAFAQGAQQGDAFGFLLPMLIIFGAFYFLLIRPQQKRQKEHKKLIGELETGDDARPFMRKEQETEHAEHPHEGAADIVEFQDEDDRPEEQQAQGTRLQHGPGDATAGTRRWSWLR